MAVRKSFWFAKKIILQTNILCLAEIDKDDKNEIECLKREIREELDSSFDEDKIEYIGTYEDVAAGAEDRKVVIKLYRGELLENPKPSSEIIKLIWLGKNDDLSNVSPAIKNKIIPDLVERKKDNIILKK